VNHEVECPVESEMPRTGVNLVWLRSEKGGGHPREKGGVREQGVAEDCQPEKKIPPPERGAIRKKQQTRKRLTMLTEADGNSQERGNNA